jgi:hypothetical protein
MNFFTPKLMKIRWSSLFFGSFAHHLSLEHTWLKFQLQICKYEWAKIIFVDRGLDSKLQHYVPCKHSWKNQKLHIQIIAVTLKVTSCKTMSRKKKWKKVKKQDFMGKTNYFLGTLPFSPWAVSATCRSSLENTWKMSLILVFNKNSPRAHTESESGVLGVHGKLVKYVVHPSKRENWKKFIFLHIGCPNSNQLVFGLKEF